MTTVRLDSTATSTPRQLVRAVLDLRGSQVTAANHNYTVTSCDSLLLTRADSTILPDTLSLRRIFGDLPEEAFRYFVLNAPILFSLVNLLLDAAVVHWTCCRMYRHLEHRPRHDVIVVRLLSRVANCPLQDVHYPLN